MPGGFEPVGVQAEVDGLDDFVNSMATMDQAVAGVGKTVDDVSGKMGSDFQDAGDAISGALTESQQTVIDFGESIGKSEGDLSGFTNKLSDVPSATQPAISGVSDLNSAVGGMSSMLGGDVLGAIATFAGAAGIGAIIAAVKMAVEEIATWISKAAEWGGTIDDLAYQTGASTEELSKFAVALGAVGIDTSALNFAFRTFNNGMLSIKQAMEQGVPPTGAFAEALQRIGVSAFDSEGNLRTFTDMFPEIADGLNALPAGAERAGTAMDIFGRSAIQMGDILEKGSEGIEQLMERAEALGLVLDEEGTASAERYEQSISKLKQAFDSLKIAVGQEALPAITGYVQGLDYAATHTRPWYEELGLLVGVLHLATDGTKYFGGVVRETAEQFGGVIVRVQQAAEAAAVQEGFWAQQADARTNILRYGNTELLNMILYSDQAGAEVGDDFLNMQRSAELLAGAVTEVNTQLLQMTADAVVGVGVVAETVDRVAQQMADTGDVAAGTLLSATNGILTEAGKIAEMGADFPKEDLDNFIGSVGKLREVITMSDLTQAQQDALIAMLDAAEQKATEAAGVVQTTATEAGRVVNEAGLTGASGWREAKAAADEAKGAMDNLIAKPYHVTVTWDRPPPEYIPESPKTHIQHALERLYDWAQSHTISVDWETTGDAGIGQGMIEDPAALWAFGQGISGAANYFANLFQAQEIDPLQAHADALTARIEELNAAMASGKLDAGQYNWVMGQLAMTEEERARVLAEMAAKQEELNRMQEAQQQLEFLDQQMKLLDLISQYGLNPEDILQGVELGAGADVEAILAALTRAMEAIIAQGAEAFGGGGATLPVEPGGGGVITSAPLTPLLGSRTAAVQVTVGPNYISNGMDEAMFAARVERIVADAITTA